MRSVGKSSIATPGVSRRGGALRWGAEFTRWVTAPWILLLLPLAAVVQNVTGSEMLPNLDQAGLEQAGRYPALVAIPRLVDGSTHLFAFVTALTVFAVLRARWPVRSALLLVLAALQMLFGMGKAVTSSYIATSLGAAYLSADQAARAAFLPAGVAASALNTGLQDLDTYSLVALLIVLSLLPREAELPRAVRIIGGIVAGALVLDGMLSLLGVDTPLFFAVIALLPVYFFLLGSWLKRQVSGDARLEGQPGVEIAR